MSAGTREDRSRKRRKVDNTTASSAPSFTSAHQLHQLLHFAPSTSPQDVKAGIDQFAQFLSSISSNESTSQQARQLKVLKDYCDEQSSTSHDQLDFPDLLSAWSTASQGNVDAILLAVPTALTQFFRSVSSHLDFRDFGLSLCHSLLKRDQLRIFDRNLSSPRAKEHLITPCLQLLREIAVFDGGALVSNVFHRRDFLYRRLDGILSQTPAIPTRHHDITSHQAALEFLGANLKYLDSASKSELITHGRLIYSAIRSLSNVDAVTVVGFLLKLEGSVLGDDNLGKPMKIRCFNSGVLSMLAKLYDYEAGEGLGPSPEVRDALQHLLLQVCVSAKGIILAQTGWYPVGSNPAILEQDEDMIDLGLDSPFHFDDYTDSVSVKNTTLATFIQTFRPEQDVLQANLITAIFGAAPELVASYFTRKQKLLVAPGDDPTWRGQFGFLFSIIQLPVPQNMGWPGTLPLMPPPMSIMIESILPRPLDRAILGKCLRMSEETMTVSAARLLTVAFQKLETVLELFARAADKSDLWRQASLRLVNLFVDRVPPLHELVTALQKVVQDDEQTRTTILECVAIYIKVLPTATSTTKFDFGAILTKAVQTLDSEKPDAEVKSIVSEQIQHLVQIADISSTTKWFHKASSDDVSLIVRLFRYCIKDLQVSASKQALPILRSVLVGKGIISDGVSAFKGLISSLSVTKKWKPELVTYQYLDNCLSRTLQKPVKYLDQLEQIQQLLSDSADLSLLACCVAEQWQFLVKKEDKNAIKNCAEWVARLFSALDMAGENYRVMENLKEDMYRQCDGHEKAKAVLEKAFEKQRKKPLTLPELRLDEAEAIEIDFQKDGLVILPVQQEASLDLADIFPSTSPIPDSLAGLDRWTNPDFESENHTGRLSKLTRCLISSESEIRLQAFHSLQSVIYAVDQSTYEEKAQLFLLLSELCETVKAHSLMNSATTPPPSIVAELAIHFLPIISDPSSPFYRKTNNFLLRSPVWSIPHILTYWIKETFLTEPEIDDTDIPFHVPQGGPGGNNNAQAMEIEHFLDLLIGSLRTEEDMNLFRRAQVFTRLFSYYLAPITPKILRKKILHLVYRATAVRGGSDTLITRAGMREWLAIAKTVRGHSGQGAMFGKIDEEVKGWIEAITRQVERTCDRDGIRRWEEERRIFRETNGDTKGSQVKEDAVEQRKMIDVVTNGVKENGDAIESGEDDKEDQSDEDVDMDRE